MLITRVILMMIDVVMTSHGIFAYKILLSVVLHYNVFGLRSSGTSRRKRSKYLQTYTQVVLFAANPRKKMLLSGNLERMAKFPHSPIHHYTSIYGALLFSVSPVRCTCIIKYGAVRKFFQAHASRKSQRLIHERVTRCVTRC